MNSPEAPAESRSAWIGGLLALIGAAILAQVLVPTLGGRVSPADPDFLLDLSHTCSLLLFVQAALLLRMRRLSLPLAVGLCLPSALLALVLGALGGRERHVRTFLALPPVLFLACRPRPRQKPAPDGSDQVS